MSFDHGSARFGPTPWLVLILAAAAILRFTGLDWGLRHPPHPVEQPFIDYTLDMVRLRDFNHRYHEYPGLFLYLLAGPVSLAGLGPRAYLAGRAVVATFGVASVLLVFLLGRSLGRPRAGLFAAALLAVSPLEVRTAHMIRPDIVLETFALMFALAVVRLDGRRLPDLLAGAAWGAATAVKFTGVLLLPAYLAHRAATPGRRLSGVALALLGGAVAFVTLSPYSVLHLRQAWQGAQAQVSWHYAEPVARTSYLDGVVQYGWVYVEALGPLGLPLFLLGIWLWRREWRRWIALAAYPLAVLVVLSSADARWARFTIPTLGMLALFAGVALERLAARSTALAAAGVLLTLGMPLNDSVRYAADVAKRGPRDAAADWIEAYAPLGSRILVTSAANVGLDPQGFDVLRVERLDLSGLDLAREVDLVVMGAGDDRALLKHLDLLFDARSQTATRVQVLAPRGRGPRGSSPLRADDPPNSMAQGP